MTKRPYGLGRVKRAPEARLTETELARLRAVEQRDGVSHADWIMRHVEEDEMENLQSGDSVNVKYNGRWHKENGKLVVFHISRTWYTTEKERQYSVHENGDTFNANEVRRV